MAHCLRLLAASALLSACGNTPDTGAPPPDLATPPRFDLTTIVDGATPDLTTIVDGAAPDLTTIVDGAVPDVTAVVDGVARDVASPVDAAARPDLASGGDMAVVVFEQVSERNNSPARTGLYVQPTLNRMAAGRVKRDLTFDGTVVGNVYAQPLYVGNGPNGNGVFIVVTEANNVVALDETSGKPVWTQNLGPAPNDSGAGCGNIHPLGITGTPVIDVVARAIYLDAVLGTGAGNGTTISTHRAHALSLDTGQELANWPVDMNGRMAGAHVFNPVVQNQRGALVLVGGTLYIPFGGHDGDCGSFRGWVIGVPLANPGSPVAWAPDSAEAGIWAPGGLASDGTNVYAATGNGHSNQYGQQESVVRLQPGPSFSGNAADYWTPSNWAVLDGSDLDLGGSGPLLVDVPGATPSALVVAMGKDGWVYLLDRSNLGGIANAVTRFHAINGEIINVAASVTTANGTFVYLHGRNGAQGASCPNAAGDLVALQIGAAAPPTVTTVWCGNNGGQGQPMVTTTDGRSEAVVWSTGAEASNRLHAWDAETGVPIFTGGGVGDAMTGLRRYTTPIAVKGRILTAADNKLYAFSPQ